MSLPPLSILQVISQRHLSGAERVCLMLSEALQRRGHRIRLLCKHNEGMLEEAHRRGLETRTPGISGKLNPLVAPRILKMAREIQADVIHTHLSTASLWGSVAGRLGGIPALAHVHAMNSRHCFMLSDRMVACSEGVRQHLIGQGVSPSTVEVVYNGIEPQRLAGVTERAEMRRSLGLGPETPAIACIAHLADKKGQADLIRAVALLSEKWPELRCFLAGIGENSEALKHLAAELGVARQVIQLGYRKDAPSIINAMDLVILPSLGKEGLPLVLLEGALLGRAAICSDIPGNNEVVQSGTTGLLFPPGDAGQLARQIDTLLSDHGLRSQMGTAAQERAKREFTIDAVVDKIEAIYRNMIAAKKK